MSEGFGEELAFRGPWTLGLDVGQVPITVRLVVMDGGFFSRVHLGHFPHRGEGGIQILVS
jgi:hypothetical protein